MKYLSIDIESTGLKENCHIIEFAMIPFDADKRKVEEHLAKSYYIQCPSFEDLKPNLDPWVQENMKKVIDAAHENGMPLSQFKTELTKYLESAEVKSFFSNEKITLFGKSMNAIDLPFLNRDLGWDYMRSYFKHRVLDLTSYVYGLIDMKLLPVQTESGSELMKFLNMGKVAHTALDDARNTAIMYFKLIDLIPSKN